MTDTSPTTRAEEAQKSKLHQLRTKLAEIDAELLGLAEKEVLTLAEEERWQDLNTERDAVKPEYDKIEARAVRAEEIRTSVFREVHGMPEVRKPTEDLFGRDIVNMGWREARDGALRILNETDSNYVLSSPAGDYLEKQVRKDSDLARRIIATENEHYRSAWFKLVTDPTAAAILTDEEREAVRAQYTYRQASERAGGQSTTVGSGGYAVPVFIDPSVILTDQETDNPFLQICRVVDVNTGTWKGVSSAGMTWSFDAEGTEVSDDSLTSITQPTVTVYTARGFIPYTLEIEQDWPGFQTEMARLLGYGYDELLVNKFSAGTGSGEPNGIKTALETNLNGALKVIGTTNGQYGQEDVYKVWGQLPQRYRRRASWMMSVDFNNRTRQLGTSTNFHAYSVNIQQSNLQTLFGRPVYESPYFPSFTGTTTVNETRLIVGDFDNYVIARRSGMTIELVPHVTSVGNNFPRGHRGWFAWARIGGNVVNTAAFRVLLNTSA